jgi:hypothetical protein
VDTVPDPILLRKSGRAGNRIRDLRYCRQELWPLEHRGDPAERVNRIYQWNYSMTLRNLTVRRYNWRVYWQRVAAFSQWGWTGTQLSILTDRITLHRLRLPITLLSCKPYPLADVAGTSIKDAWLSCYVIHEGRGSRVTEDDNRVTHTYNACKQNSSTACYIAPQQTLISIHRKTIWYSGNVIA